MPQSNPWMKSFLLTAANANFQLLALMQAVDADAPKYFQALQIQADVDGGAARWRIGNSDMTDILFGVLLFATQAFGISSLEQNLLALQNIYIRCDTINLRVSVSVVVR